VIGIDISEAMIKRAKNKIERENLPVEFYVQDMRNFDLGKKFDVAICLFGTFGYCITDDEISFMLSSLKTPKEKQFVYL